MTSAKQHANRSPLSRHHSGFLRRGAMIDRAAPRISQLRETLVADEPGRQGSLKIEIPGALYTSLAVRPRAATSASVP